MNHTKMNKAHVEALCEIVINLFPIKEDYIITQNCEIAENALYKGGIEKWAKDNEYIPFGDGYKLWSHGFGSVDQYILVIEFCEDIKSKVKEAIKKATSLNRVKNIKHG